MNESDVQLLEELGQSQNHFANFIKYNIILYYKI